MKAVALTRYLPISDPQSLFDTELPAPVPLAHDLLVRVEAVSVNPVDTKVRAPKPHVEPSPRVLGWDAAGVVEAVGPAVTRFKPGDQVIMPAMLPVPAQTPSFNWWTSASSDTSRTRSILPKPPLYRSPPLPRGRAFSSACTLTAAARTRDNPFSSSAARAALVPSPSNSAGWPAYRHCHCLASGNTKMGHRPRRQPRDRPSPASAHPTQLA